MKRILIFALLLAFALPAWGVARTLYPAQDAMNWSAAEWSLADDNAKNQAKPAAGELDTVYFTANSGDVTLDENSAALALLRMDTPSAYTGTLALGANTLTVDGPCVLRSTISGTGTIDVGDGNLLSYATVADAITLLLTTSGSHDITLFGTGGSVNINCTGDYTVKSACDSYALTLTAGTLVGGEYTWTVGAGGFTFTDGTLTGELDVDLSGSTGAYVQTAGIIDAAAVLNVAAGSGGFSWTALTKTGTLNVTVTASMTGSWATSASPFDLLTVNSPATLTADAALHTHALAGTGNVAGATFYIDVKSDNFWTLTGTGSSADIRLGVEVVASNAALIDIGTGNYVQSWPNALTLNGGLTCGDVSIVAATGANFICNGPLTASGTVTLGSGTSYGTLTLGPSQVHRIGSTIARSGTSVANAIIFGGRVWLGGPYDGTGITPTWGGALFATGNLTFDGKEVAGANASPGMDIFANAKTVTVQGVNNSTAATPIRVWNNATAGAANTNCVFHPGAPSGASMMGMGN